MPTRKGTMNSAPRFEEHLLRDKSWNPFSVSLIESSNRDPHETEAWLSVMEAFWNILSEHHQASCVLTLHCVWGSCLHPETHVYKPLKCNCPSKFWGGFADSPYTVSPRGIHLKCCSDCVRSEGNMVGGISSFCPPFHGSQGSNLGH